MPVQTKPYTITPIPMGKSNAYLVSATGFTFLIDAGCDKNIHKIERTLQRNGLDITDIDLIIVTHTHYDHVGRLAEIREKSGAKVLVHRDEADCLKKGYTPFPKGTMVFSRLISGVGNRFFQAWGSIHLLILMSVLTGNVSF